MSLYVYIHPHIIFHFPSCKETLADIRNLPPKDDQKVSAGGLRMDIVFESLIFGDRWDQNEYSATEMVWGQEFLPKRICEDLELFGVRDLDLVFYTRLGEASRGRNYYYSSLESSLELDVVKKVKAAYTELGMKPKYSDEVFLRGRKSWGSLGD